MTTALWQRTATELSDLMARGEVSSREVVDAHLERIGSVNGSINAFTTVFYERARDEATKRDDERAKGTIRGPLHGLPVSVKECFDMEGLVTTLGIPAWRDRVATRDASMVTVLREAGAVIVGRTNLSQTMLFVESRNPVFGQTANPFSLAHSPGGSSGGEGAAIASGMSPLGIGTDIGGSIRTPAHFSGIVGLKTTLDRLPAKGQSTVLAGQEAVRSASGPMARSVGDLWLFLRALDPKRLSALDGRVPPMGFDDPAGVDVRGLRVGFYVDDGVVTVSRSIARAIDRAREVLVEQGCEVTPFTPPDIATTLGYHLSALSSDGAETLKAAIGDPNDLDPVMVPLWRIANLPDEVRRALAGVLGLVGQGRSASLLKTLGEKPVAEYWKLVDRLRAARSTVTAALDAQRIDVVLSPVFATPAVPHGMAKNFTLASSPSILWNVHQFPAGVVPVTRVRADETRREPSRDLVERHAAKVDAQSEGLPVGVQVVARPWMESKVLAVMAAIERGVKNDVGFPHTPVTPR